eukprot:1603489-Rhodomonas_salina.8
MSAFRDGRGATPLLAKAVTDALSDDDVSSSDSKGSNTMHLDSYVIARAQYVISRLARFSVDVSGRSLYVLKKTLKIEARDDSVVGESSCLTRV